MKGNLTSEGAHRAPVLVFFQFCFRCVFASLKINHAEQKHPFFFPGLKNRSSSELIAPNFTTRGCFSFSSISLSSREFSWDKWYLSYNCMCCCRRLLYSEYKIGYNHGVVLSAECGTQCWVIHTFNMSTAILPWPLVILFCQPLCLIEGGSPASKQVFICRGIFCPENDDGPFWLFSFKASLEVFSLWSQWNCEKI